MVTTMTAAGLLAVLAADNALEWFCVDSEGNRCDAESFPDLVPAGPFAELTFDSHAVVPGTLFVCKGAAFKERYLCDAASRGARAYVSQHVYSQSGLPGVIVGDVRRAMALIACSFFGNPSHSLRVVGVTGTKGKTTVAFYVDAILRARGSFASGMLTGIAIDDGMARCASHNTTPESVELQRHLAHAVAAGCDTVVMEASSQGLKYDRTLGTRFEVGVFTNIGEDHISPIEHPTFDDYFASKMRLFDQCSCSVVNLETDRVREVLCAARRSGRVLTYSTDALSNADVRLSAYEKTGEGRWSLEVETPRGALSLAFDALGFFNVSNALAAIAVAEALLVDRRAIEKGLAHVRVPGRMERYDTPDGAMVGIVDYAHNEMSMEALLSAVRSEFPHREVTVVFGSTGERATHRREGLGRAAGKLADRIILTEDDPGRVPVGQICAEIGKGVREQGGVYTVIEDRVEAVRTAVAGAHRPAVVVLAGKGAENTILRACGSEPCLSDAQLFCRTACGENAGAADGRR